MKNYTLSFLLFCLSLLLCSSLPAQNHDNLWLFGVDGPYSQAWGGCVVDFSNNEAVSYYQERDMNLNVTVASICDSLGNLLFYTNGTYIANHLHEKMENGDNLNPGELTSDNYSGGLRVNQSEIILPAPDQLGKYYLIHNKLDYHPTWVLSVSTSYFSFINMNANNGEGKVMSKNVEIINDQNLNFGFLTAVKHGNGRDWWVTFPFKSKNVFYKILITPEGVELIPEQTIFPPLPDNLTSNGFITFTQDGSHLARYEFNHGIYLYDFDRCTGMFEDNPLFIPMPNNTGLGGGISFSPSGQFLYAVTSTKIFQFDLWVGDIVASMETVAEYDGYADPLPTSFFTSQLGPDGKIYINTNNGAQVLHYINYPDKKGLACEVVQHGLQLATRNRFTSQHFPNYRLGPLDGSPCDTLGLDNVPVAKYRYEQDTLDYLQVEFTDLSYYEPAGWHWDFGDNMTSQDTSPVHVFPQTGTYEVCLTVSNANGEHTFCRTLELGTVSSLEEAQEVGITIFPNPCREGVNVIISDYLPKDAKVVLYDAVGRQHKVQEVRTGWNTLRLDGLGAGIYFYQIWEKDVLMDSGKLMKIE